MPRGRTSRHLPSMYITVFLCETLRVRFIFPCALHANLYLVVRVTMFAGDRSLTDKQREMKRCQEVWAVMVVAEARDAKILCLPRRVSPSGGETVTETLRSREGRPRGRKEGPADLGWSPVQSLFPQSGTFRLVDLFSLEQSTANRHLALAPPTGTHRPAEGSLPSSCGSASHRGGGG